MKAFQAFIAAALILGILAYKDLLHMPLHDPVPKPVSLAPTQIMLSTPQSFIHRKDYTLTKVASYTITARLLSRERYFLDRWSGLSPIDLVLGWGIMTNKKVISGISFSQGGRFYSWHTSEFPVPQEQIIANTANTHIIPATDDVSKAVKAFHAGQFVRLKGYLVNVAGPDGSWWNTSSLGREDEGDGACELFYVESATAL